MEGIAGQGNEPANPEGAAVSESDVLGCLPGVRAMILRMTRDRALTNDLTQDVMIAVVVAVREGRIKQGAALAGYVHQTARHIVYASNRKMRPVTLDTLPEHESAWQDAPTTPLEYCEEEELRRMAMEVLDELPTQRDRDLITGYYIDGLSKAELTQRLQLGLDHFDKVIFRARTRMRDRIHAKMNERRPEVGDSAASSIPSSGKLRFE